MNENYSEFCKLVMSVFNQLGKLYYDIHNKYSLLELQARTKGHRIKEEEYRKKRELNDQAYFLFMFTRLEDRIKILSQKLILSKSLRKQDDKNKRAWDIIKDKHAKDRLNLMERVSLLARLNSPDFNLIKRYKVQRDTIAHGGNVPAINISSVLLDLKRLYSDLNQ